MTNHWRALLLRAMGLLSAVLLGTAAQAAPILRGVDRAVAPYVGRQTPGLGVVVLQNGVVVHMRGYGLADIATSAPVTVDSQFDLASVSKQMTALAVMMQIEDGLYATDTPIGAILPAFAAEAGTKRPVTVGHLLHHTGGLADYLDGEMAYQPSTPNDEVVAWLAGADRAALPGKVFDYSNSGYVVLGSLVTQAAGAKELGAVLQARVWGPLEMTATDMVVPQGKLVTGYAGKKGRFRPVSDLTITEGDGNVYSTLQDMARYEAGLVGHRLISASTTARLFETGQYDNGRAIDDDGAGYGWGWVIETYEGENYASHSGSWTGTATYYQRNLTTGITVIILANGEDADVTEIGGEVELAVESALAE